MDLYKTSMTLLCNLALASASLGTTYYMDADNGSDSAQGTSPETAWKSIAFLNKQKVEPGDRILFRRGCIFRGGTLALKSGKPDLPVLFSSYGEGTKPIIQPSLDYAHDHLWEEYQPGIWKTKSSLSYKLDETSWVDLRQSDWGIYREDPSVVKCTKRVENGQNIMTLSCTRHGARETNIQFIGPAVKGPVGTCVFSFRIRSNKPFELSKFMIQRSGSPWNTYCIAYSKAINVTSDWQDIQLLMVNTSKNDNNHPMRLANFIGKALPDNSEVEFAPISLQPAQFTGTLPLLGDVGNIIFNHGEYIGWKKWGVEQLKSLRDYYYQDGEGSVYMRHDGNPGTSYASLEFATRSGVSHGDAHDVIVDGLWVRYAGAHGFGGGNAARVTIRNCDISYIGGAVLWNTKPIPTRFGNGIEFWCQAEDCLVENNKIWEVYDVAITNQGNAPNTVQRNLIYRNNLLLNCEQHYEYWRSPKSSTTENIQFVGNTCLNAGYGWSHRQRPDKRACHLLGYQIKAETKNIVIKNNVFCNSINSLMWYLEDVLKIMDMDHNLWFKDEQKGAAGDIIRIENLQLNVPNGKFNEWQSQHGKDVHSVYAMPIFRRPDWTHPEKGDFRLAPASPGATGATDGGAIGIR